MAGIFPSIGKGKPGLEAGVNPTGKETIDELGAGISSIARWVRFGPPGRSGDPQYGSIPPGALGVRRGITGEGSVVRTAYGSTESRYRSYFASIGYE